MKTLIGLGVARGQLMEARAICTYMGGGPTLVLLASASAVQQYQLKPLARLVSYAHAGVDPEFIGNRPGASVPTGPAA
ncbi:hypothetical protein LLG90_27690, partial [Aromatoleum toluclasticum]|nr:hypothetical protein [Aromatoleum toluclasticum]